MESWDEDETAYSGHDVYLGDEDEVPVDHEEDVVEDDPDITEDSNTFEGVDEQRQSIINLLNSAVFICLHVVTSC
jgi:hypothetical protein